MPNQNVKFYGKPVPYYFDMYDHASEMLVRANPKLSTNVKLMTNGEFVMLESFNACKEISGTKFKNITTYKNSRYNQDISKFWKSIQKTQAYYALQEYDNQTVKEKYESQYETFYWSGCEYIDSLEYSENFGILAPIWLDDKIPEKFVVFRVTDPSYWNFNEYEGVPKDIDFTNDILNKCEIIKTFDLSENSRIGSYIRSYYNQDKFPKAPLSMDNDYLYFNGIGFDNGDFVSVREPYDERFWKHDETVLEFDEYITLGFERNGVIVANLLNIEFLFDDPKAEDYSFARYFGLYCDTLKDGTFKVCKEDFYDKGNTYDFIITDFEPGAAKKYIARNIDGVNLPAREITDIELFPNLNLTSEINGVFCVKDIENQLHSVSRLKDSNTNDYAIRLVETEIDMKKFAGYVPAVESVSCKYEDNTTKSSLSLKIKSGIPQYSDIVLYHNNTVVGTLHAVMTNENDPNGTLYPGEYSYDMFCGNGTFNDIAKAIAGSFNSVFDLGIKAYYYDDTVYFISMNSTPAYNLYSMKFDSLAQIDYDFSNNGNFFGSNQHAHVKCKEENIGSFKTGDYLPSRISNGFTKIIGIVPDFDDAITNGNKIEFPNGKWYDILLENSGLIVQRTNEIKTYSDFETEYLRLSFYPVRDFEMSTYKNVTKYGDLGELNYEIQNIESQSQQLNALSDNNQNNNADIVINDPDMGEIHIPLTINFNGNLSCSDIQYAVTEDTNGYTVIVSPMIYNDNYSNSDSASLSGNFNFDTLSTTLNVPNLTYLTSEYDRCYENLNPELMLKSKTQPWICPWVMKNGLDIREKPYRLNNNQVFGQYSFTPDTTELSPNPLYYNQEWTYIMGKPMISLYGSDEKYADQRNIWSYIGMEISSVDDFEDKLRSTTENWFDVFFKRDHIRTLVDDGNNNIINTFYSTPDYAHKYSLLANGSDNTSAETFFRGAKIEVIMKSDWDEKIDNNLDNIKIKYGSDLNDYKFTAVCVPITIEDGSELKFNKTKIIRNDVFKTITLIVYVVKKYQDAAETLFNLSNPSSIELEDIRRYLLYNSAKNNDKNHSYECKPISVKGTGKIRVANSANGLVITGENTSFLTDFALYNPVDTYYEDQYDSTVRIPYKKELLAINNISYIDSNQNYLVSFGIEITSVESDTLMYGKIISNFAQDSIYEKIRNTGTYPYNPYNYFPQWLTNNAIDYFIVNCDYDQFAQNLDKNVFGSIFYSINTSQDEIIYELVDDSGNFISTDSANPKYPFALRFVSPMNNAKYEYLSLAFDGEFITYGILPTGASAMYRHYGMFTPLRNDVLYFTDPYIKQFSNDPDFATTGPKKKLFTESRHLNTCFDTDVSDFGILHNVAFHRTNENNSNVFKLTNDEKPIYPTSNRFAIGNRSIAVFNSNWDPWYFTRTLSNTSEQECHGTLSMKESKAFFGSKCLSVPDEFIFDIFNNETVTYVENNSNIELNVNVEKVLTDKLISDLNPLFADYISVIYSYGDKTTITDDIEEYVKQNLLKLYQLSYIKLWIKTESANATAIDWNGLTYSAAQKETNNLKESSVMGISTIPGNDFNKKIIMNIKSGTKYTIGLKIKLTKK